MNVRYCVLILSAFCLGMPLRAQAYELRRSRTGAIIRHRKFPIHYYVDSNPAMAEWAVEPVIRAFQNWENVGPSRASFVYRGLVDNPAVANDGKNCVIWVAEGWRHGSQTIAHATTWYSLEDGEMAGCDIELNARDYNWSTSEEPSEGTLDIQNVITHEVGHFLGLDDVNTLDGTMFGFILREETNKRSLHRDDIEGSSFLYPLSATFGSIEASSIDQEGKKLSPLLPPRDTPEGTNIILISSCDWDGDGTSGEIAAVSYEADSGFAFHVYRLPDTDKGEKEIATLAKDEWMISSSNNARGMAVVDTDGDGRNEIAILKDNEEGESFINVYKFSSTMDTPSLICSIYLGKSDSTTHMAAMNGDEVWLLRKVKGGKYDLSLYKLDIPKEDLSLKEDYGELPVDPDDEVLCLFRLEEEPEKATALGVLVIDRKGRARIDFLEPTADGEIASSLSIQLPGSSPVLATSFDPNEDGRAREIVLITE